MVYSEDKKEKKPDLFKCLRALSNNERMEIFKLVQELGGKVQFSVILKKIYPNDDSKSSTLSNHLRKLLKISIFNKDSDGYFITPLGKELNQYISGMERVFQNFNKELLVRTSDYCLEPFDENEIVEFLIREGHLNKKEAHKIAAITKKRLLTANIDYLTTPMIREFVNVILLENGFEDIRHKLTRLGLVQYDIKRLLQTGNIPDVTTFFKELGKNMFSQFLLLNQLPLGSADFYLSGTLFFNHLERFGLIPSELVISGRRLAEIIINKNLSLRKLDRPIYDNKNQDFESITIIIKNIIEEFKEFFSAGIIVTEFEYLIHELSLFFKKKPDSITKTIISLFSNNHIYTNFDPRHFTDENWELWIEISLDSKDVKEEIKSIINEYFNDILELNDFNDKDKQNRYKNLLKRLSSKPNLLINLSPSIKEQILAISSIRDLPDFINKLLISGLYHNIIFINPYNFDKKDKNHKKVMTPNLAPIKIPIEEFAGQNIISRPQLILDKIFINLPRIVQISEEITDIPLFHSTNSKDKIKTKNNKPKDFEKFLNTLKEWVYNAMNLFLKKFSLIHKNLHKLKKWDQNAELIFGKEFLSEKVDLIDYNNNIKLICNISLNGLIETVGYFSGLYPDQNEDSAKIMFEIITLVSDLLKKNSTKSVDYVLSQPHLDNYLQIKFIQDINLLQSMTSEFLDIDAVQGLLKGRHSDPHNYSITNFMDRQLAQGSSKLNPYIWTINRLDKSKSISKLIGYFRKFQNIIEDTAILDIMQSSEININLKTSQLSIIQDLLKNEIQFFNFSRLLGEGKNIYYRHNGCYKSINYYEKLIRNYILKSKINN